MKYHLLGKTQDCFQELMVDTDSCPGSALAQAKQSSVDGWKMGSVSTSLSVELCGPFYEKFIDFLDKSLEELIGYYRQNVF